MIAHRLHEPPRTGRRAPGDDADVLILAYHAVSPAWPAPLSVSVERFAAQIRLLAKCGYRGITVSDAVHRPPRGRSVAVTFDDAYRSVLDHAFPLLQRIGFPATVFVPTNFPDQDGPMTWPGIDHWLGGPYEHELRCLSWSQLRVMANAGWEIGSHSQSHAALTELSDQQLDRELRGSRLCCEQEMQRECRSLAYPFGAHDDRVVRAAHEAGYIIGCTVPDRLAASDPLRTPRVGIWHHDGRLAFHAKTSTLVRRARTNAIAGRSLPLFRALLLRWHGRPSNDSDYHDHRPLGS